MLKQPTKFALIRQTRTPSVGQFCNYAPRVCMRTRVEGYEYCLSHILEDKNSPYKQCTYVSSKTNRRCMAAAPRMEKRDGFCPEHTRKTVQSRNRMMTKGHRTKNLHTLLDDLGHHVVKQQPTDDVRQKGTKAGAAQVLECASDSDSGRDAATVKEIWKTDEESDLESIDSEQEDPLKHAGVYTAEEVASILRDKLIRLQSLYIDQFRYLHHLLREKRRKYLRGLSQLQGTHSGSVEKSPDMTPAERVAHDKLFALRRYQRRFGKEALLHRQCKQRRIAFSEGANYKPPAFPECCAIKDDGTKCTAHVLPLSKHCSDHITSDARQVLFRHCNFGSFCQQCIVNFDDKATCDLHHQMEPLMYRYNRKQEEAEMKDEPVDVVGLTDIQVDLCHDLSCDIVRCLSGQPAFEEVNDSTEQKYNPSTETE